MTLLSKRQKPVFVLLLLALGFTSATTNGQLVLPTYIIAGQSNAEGFGVNRQACAIQPLYPKEDLYSIAYAHYDVERSDIVIIKGTVDQAGVTTGWQHMRPIYGLGSHLHGVNNKYFGPELSFGHRLQQLTQQTIGIIKYAKGATTVAVDWDPTFSGNNQYDYLGYTIITAIIQAQQLGVELDIKGVCWMQGESDAVNLGYAQNYKQNLQQLIAWIRSFLQDPNMPFYIATIKDSQAWTYRNLIWQAQEEIADEDANSYLVEGRDLPTYIEDVFGGVHLHYTTSGIITLGHRFAQAIVDNNLQAFNPDFSAAPAQQAFESAFELSENGTLSRKKMPATNIAQGNTSKNRFLLFPNPGGSEVEIKSFGQIDNIRVEVFNFLGETVINTEYHMGNSIDMSAYPPGIYLFKLSGSDGDNHHHLKTLKWVKQ